MTTSKPGRAKRSSATEERVREARIRARREALKEAASFVSLASVSDPSPLDGIGGLKLSEMNETAQTAMHAACQALAIELHALARRRKP